MWKAAIVGGGLLASGYLRTLTSGTAPAMTERSTMPSLPTRAEQMNQLKSTEFDVLIIGGGATGSGIALDAATRGLRVALVEQNDFSSGTSSRSTKLLHGGVRYLEKAVMQLDKEQYDLVTEALHERDTLLTIAPHIARELKIMVPIYRWWELPYMWIGLKVYDALAWWNRHEGAKELPSSYLLSRKSTLASFPQLNEKGLRGSVVYYDGQHDDAGMTLSVALTAAREGTVTANYTEVISLLKTSNVDGTAHVSGARVKDRLTGEEMDVSAKCVINATGCFTDGIMRMDNKAHRDLVIPSQGLHIVLPDYFTPPDMGLLIPETSDGRVLFMLPWEGSVVAGTTDSMTDVSELPSPKSSDVAFVREELDKKLASDVQLRNQDIKAVWSGIRPLVRNPASSGTEDVPRSHFVYVSDSKLVSISGGKWTTYRRMAEDTVDEVLRQFPSLQRAGPCVTRSTPLVGAKGYADTLPHVLVQKYNVSIDVATHLSHRYGSAAFDVLDLDPSAKLLHPNYPYLEAEVQFAVQHEYAVKPQDVLARRTRLAFLDSAAAVSVAGKVTDIMAKELNWSRAQRQQMTADSTEFLNTMTPHLEESAKL
eukprot:m.153209 g.153209  ORF g.153209 m.153209 type:complete len:595 (-) comp14284_c0_seq1:2467-4251(-)